jgi:exodeoxyribonuclease VII large subunit
MTDEVTLSVSEFVGLLNQTLEYAYTNITIIGELANFRVSKSRWVYFDLKDGESCVKFFGTVYQLPGPIEDGMMLAVRGTPRLHPQYGFSVTTQAIRPVGKGSIKKAAQLLQAQLAAEGLFDEARKRPLPYPPKRIGLITSYESAAYRDFMKIIDARWQGVEIVFVDVQVQGEAAAAQVCIAVEQLNQLADPPEILVMARGGGSAEDLAPFSTEQDTRAIAASRIPTLVAIGHEIDTCLAELAADQRASTPSNAAELLVPDRKAMLDRLREQRKNLMRFSERCISCARDELRLHLQNMKDGMSQILVQTKYELQLKRQLLDALSPQAALARGYVLVRKEGAILRSKKDVARGDIVEIELSDGRISAEVKEKYDKK